MQRQEKEEFHPELRKIVFQKKEEENVGCYIFLDIFVAHEKFKITAEHNSDYHNLGFFSEIEGFSFVLQETVLPGCRQTILVPF